MAANFRQAAGTAASVAADERGVTRSQSQIHDSPRNIRLELRAFDPVPIAPVGAKNCWIVDITCRCNSSFDAFGAGSAQNARQPPKIRNSIRRLIRPASACTLTCRPMREAR
jgi:hypothetical protein